MKFTKSPNLVEKEEVIVEVWSAMKTPSVCVSRSNHNPKNDEIRNAVKSAGYAVERVQFGVYMVTGGTPESLEILANEIRAAYAGEPVELVDSDAAKINEIVKILVLADHVTAFGPNFNAMQAAETCGAMRRHLINAKRILEILK